MMKKDLRYFKKTDDVLNFIEVYSPKIFSYIKDYKKEHKGQYLDSYSVNSIISCYVNDYDNKKKLVQLYGLIKIATNNQWDSKNTKFILKQRIKYDDGSNVKQPFIVKLVDCIDDENELLFHKQFCINEIQSLLKNHFNLDLNNPKIIKEMDLVLYDYEQHYDICFDSDIPTPKQDKEKYFYHLQKDENTNEINSFNKVSMSQEFRKILVEKYGIDKKIVDELQQIIKKSNCSVYDFWASNYTKNAYKPLNVNEYLELFKNNENDGFER